ncbi:MAG TPA: TlpA disulfide reductase family protein [Isosphaeraceae bacterium]|jgi:thiol-disulfide isomerase/thioredoxin|nr:TlpA disulfide reductase family protein [Isosphaeraceae bacterium]
MTTPRKALVLARAALAAALLAPPASAQDEPPESGRKASGRFDSLESLNASYTKQYEELERRQIADLTALAGRQAGSKAEATYRQLFNFAVARGQYNAAAKAAANYLEAERNDPQLRALATLIDATVKVDNKQEDEALKGIERFVRSQKAGGQKLDPDTIFTVGEAFLQRLVRNGSYDIARRTCDVFLRGDPDKSVRDHFSARLTRLNLMNKPAPPISGVDVDNREVRLTDLRGKVVLVDFWATWAPPCVAEVPHYQALLDKYGSQGFTILGVNVDASREDIHGDIARVKPTVRKFLLTYRVSWPNVFNGGGARDFAQRYGVNEVPATFLVDAKGNIVDVERSGADLDRAVAKALGVDDEAKDKEKK